MIIKRNLTNKAIESLAPFSKNDNILIELAKALLERIKQSNITLRHKAFKDETNKTDSVILSVVEESV